MTLIQWRIVMNKWGNNRFYRPLITQFLSLSTEKPPLPPPPPYMSTFNRKELQEQAQQTMSKERYNICFNAATEPPFSGQYWNHHKAGIYRCAVCQTALFDSQYKFDSGTGWPSFSQALGNQLLEQHTDQSHGMIRVEVRCFRCGCHLGHVFKDGPPPTGNRFCINSASLDFVPHKQ